MGFKLNKKNFDFGVGTGSSPNKIGTELLIGGGLEVGDKALELFEKGPNTKSGKKTCDIVIFRDDKPFIIFPVPPIE